MPQEGFLRLTFFFYALRFYDDDSWDNLVGLADGLPLSETPLRVGTVLVPECLGSKVSRQLLFTTACDVDTNILGFYES